MSDKDNTPAPRIAISFGTPAGVSNAKKPQYPRPNQPLSSLGKRPRPHHALNGDSDSSESEGTRERGRREAITELTSITKEREAPADLVIEKQKNRAWKSEVKARRRGGGKNLLPPEAQAQRSRTEVETEPADAEKQVQWGLSVRKRKPDDDTKDDGDGERDAEDEKADKSPARTADDEAIDALLGKTRVEEKTIHPSEDDAFRAGLKRVGQESTLADYDNIPDGEFGAAILRGMGWDGKMRGPKAKAGPAKERRQNQLGLGATKLNGAEDLGQWNQGGKKRPKLDEYRRGEEKRKEERRERRGEGYRDERERDRDRDRGRDGGRDGDRHRERDRDRDHHRHRNGDSRR